MSASELIKVAEACWSEGISALPFKVKGHGTVVGPKQWSKFCDNQPSKSDQDKFRQLFLNGYDGLFIACGRVHDGYRLACIDVDDDRFVSLIEAVMGPVVSGRFGSKGIGVFVWVDKEDKILKASDQIKTHEGNIAVELLSHGRGTFIAPSVHRATGKMYELRGNELWSSLDVLPKLNIEQWQIIKACCLSEHSSVLLKGGETHHAMVGLCKQLVSISNDDELLCRVVQSVFAKTYKGTNNSEREIGRTLNSVREKGYDLIPGGYPSETLSRLDRFSEDHCVVNMKGKTLVLRINYDHSLNRKCYEFSSPADLRNFYLDEFVDVPGKSGKLEPKGLGEAWFKWPNRAKANRIEMLPGKTPGLIEIGSKKTFNLWQGFQVDPKEGDWRCLKYHLCNIICAGDIDHFSYLERWLAHCIQHPDKPGEVAVVMRGGRGAGKGMFGRMLEGIFGQHYFQTAFQGQVAGRFNAHPRDVVVLFGDEAFFAGDKKHESVLKAIVTEPTLPIEAKFVDVETVKNRLHIVMATNDSWAVPAGIDERRFFVLDVSEKKKQNKEYFKSLVAAIKGDELSAMLQHLLNLDLTEFDVRTVPQTRALADQKIHSLNLVEKWVLHRLMEGSQTSDSSSEGWQEFLGTQELYEDFSNGIGRLGFRGVDVSQFAKQIYAILKTSEQRRGRSAGRVRGMLFDQLETCRKRFEQHVGFEIDWPEESDEELPGIYSAPNI